MLVRATNCNAVSWRLVYDRPPETVGSPHYLDLTDPATAGCLLAMVYERWPLSFSRENTGEWTVHLNLLGEVDRPFEGRWFSGSTLGEACARALVEG